MPLDCYFECKTQLSCKCTDMTSTSIGYTNYFYFGFILIFQYSSDLLPFAAEVTVGNRVEATTG